MCGCFSLLFFSLVSVWYFEILLIILFIFVLYFFMFFSFLDFWVYLGVIRTPLVQPKLSIFEGLWLYTAKQYLPLLQSLLKLFLKEQRDVCSYHYWNISY
jgi:hypothetical protein